MDAAEVYELIRREKIIAIVRGYSQSQILDIANSLWDGGIRLLEVTCNTEGFEEIIAALVKETAGRMVIGAGTVISKGLCDKVLEAGAEYVIAPDVNIDVIRSCVDRGLAVVPGAATATEILTAARTGAKMVKIFPAGVLGAEYIRLLRGPIDDVDFVAVGGVRLDTIRDYINAGCCAIGVGREVIKKEWVEQSEWGMITEKCKEYVEEAR